MLRVRGAGIYVCTTEISFRSNANRHCLVSKSLPPRLLPSPGPLACARVLDFRETSLPSSPPSARALYSSITRVVEFNFFIPVANSKYVSAENKRETREIVCSFAFGTLRPDSVGLGRRRPIIVENDRSSSVRFANTSRRRFIYLFIYLFGN